MRRFEAGENAIPSLVLQAFGALPAAAARQRLERRKSSVTRIQWKVRDGNPAIGSHETASFPNLLPDRNKGIGFP
jgi:hypothetical protein